MIIRVDENGTLVKEIDDLNSLKVVTSRDLNETSASVQFAGAGRIVKDHLEVDPEYLRAVAEATGLGPEWVADFEKMVAYATSQGWVTAAGALLAHIEQIESPAQGH